MTSRTGESSDQRERAQDQVFGALDDLVHVAERPLPQRQHRHGAEQVDAVVGRKLDRLRRDQRDVDANFAQSLDDLLQPLGREIARR